MCVCLCAVAACVVCPCTVISECVRVCACCWVCVSLGALAGSHQAHSLSGRQSQKETLEHLVLQSAPTRCPPAPVQKLTLLSPTGRGGAPVCSTTHRAWGHRHLTQEPTPRQCHCSEGSGPEPLSVQDSPARSRGLSPQSGGRHTHTTKGQHLLRAQPGDSHI